jgi:hypothetical protein
MQLAGQLHRERLERLSAEGASVLQYVYDEPERRADAAYALALARDALLRRQALGKVDDAHARARVLAEDATLRQFAKTHPRIFQLVTELVDGPRHFEVLQELGAVRAQVERGKSGDEANVHVSTMLLERCRRGPAPEAPPAGAVEQQERSSLSAVAGCSAASRSSTPPPSSLTASS